MSTPRRTTSPSPSLHHDAGRRIGGQLEVVPSPRGTANGRAARHDVGLLAAHQRQSRGTGGNATGIDISSPTGRSSRRIGRVLVAGVQPRSTSSAPVERRQPGRRRRASGRHRRRRSSSVGRCPAEAMRTPNMHTSAMRSVERGHARQCVTGRSAIISVATPVNIQPSSVASSTQCSLLVRASHHHNTSATLTAHGTTEHRHRLGTSTARERSGTRGRGPRGRARVRRPGGPREHAALIAERARAAGDQRARVVALRAVGWAARELGDHDAAQQRPRHGRTPRSAPSDVAIGSPKRW